MIIEIIVISIIGTLLHFTYDWSNHNKVVGIFSAVNESTWEHIKMALSATFLCSLVDIIFLGSNPNYFFAKFFSVVTIIVLMPLMYYTYKFITKKNLLFVDILSFYITIIFSQIVFRNILNQDILPESFRYLSIMGLTIIFGAYMLLTILPIKNFLFKDPVTKKYGFAGHQ